VAGSAQRPVVVSLGSNLDAERHLPAGVERLRERFAVQALSRVYRTAPIGSPGSPWFLNLALRIAPRMDPQTLKHEVFRPIEAELGRERGEDRNAPRTLDLDLTVYGDLVIDDPEAGLRLPEPEILTRAHVALPLAEVVPGWVHPVVGLAIEAIVARFEDDPGIEIVGGLERFV
jgi:2-amino-4-hydroxy-6-hydroxymethyldihydropteridine diphosphokinase